MKTMTCHQLGGACDQTFQANTFEEIAAMSQQHGMEMLAQGDQLHLDAMDTIKQMMSDPAAMQRWFESKRDEFDALPEDE